VKHLQKLVDAGLTHLHLLPTFQFGDVDDEKENWKSVGIFDVSSTRLNLIDCKRFIFGMHFLFKFEALFIELKLEIKSRKGLKSSDQ